MKECRDKTYPASILLNPRAQMFIDVVFRPVNDLVDEEWHFLFHTLDGQRPREGKERHDSSPLDPVSEQFANRRHKRLLRVVRSYIQLFTHLLEDLRIAFLKFLAESPHCSLDAPGTRARIGTVRPRKTSALEPVPDVIHDQLTSIRHLGHP